MSNVCVCVSYNGYGTCVFPAHSEVVAKPVSVAPVTVASTTSVVKHHTRHAKYFSRTWCKMELSDLSKSECTRHWSDTNCRDCLAAGAHHGYLVAEDVLYALDQIIT